MFRKAAIDAGVAAPPSLWMLAPRRLLDSATIKLHRLIVRLDAAPAEFGDLGPFDEADPKALRREWLRQARLWAAYNPEDVFALKAGALVGGVTLLGVLAVVAAV